MEARITPPPDTHAVGPVLARSLLHVEHLGPSGWIRHSWGGHDLAEAQASAQQWVARGYPARILVETLMQTVVWQSESVAEKKIEA